MKIQHKTLFGNFEYRKNERTGLCIICLLFLVILSGCAPLQDNTPIPHDNPTPQTVVQPVNQTPPNITNTTMPPKEILLPIEGFAVYILDVGSSIITLNNKSILINAAPDAIKIIKTIRNLGISELDYIILTNSEDGNIGGVAPIILRANPNKIIHSGIPSTSNYYKQYNTIYYPKNVTPVPFDDKLIFDDAVISLIVPYDDGQPLTADNNIIIKMSYGNTNILFMGNCGVDCESRISSSDIHTTILVSDGGCNSLSYLFLKESSPEHIIFTKEPCDITLNRVTGLAISVFITKKEGDVVITSTGISYEVLRT